jgi:hypothetical protein
MPRPLILSRMRDIETETKGSDHDWTKSGNPLQKSSTMVYMDLTCILGLTMLYPNENSRLSPREVTVPKIQTL